MQYEILNVLLFGRGRGEGKGKGNNNRLGIVRETIFINVISYERIRCKILDKITIYLNYLIFVILIHKWSCDSLYIYIAIVFERKIVSIRDNMKINFKKIIISNKVRF